MSEPGDDALASTLELLTCGELEIEGRMPWSSNATFLVNLALAERRAQGIYKPHRGERPLWDFPSGLYQREVAAWHLSRALGWEEAVGWGGVPPTVVRDGPFGIGSLQLFVVADFEQHYFPLYEQREDLHLQLMAICAFDIVANNTDRKSGHCLIGLDGRMWGIDQGLCFSVEPKLRTVIWEFGGGRVPEELMPGLAAVAAAPPPALTALLNRDEVEAVTRRAASLCRNPVFPVDPTGHRYPWPLV
jgi:uncharacterized repeat protein (TIGR03843 family)